MNTAARVQTDKYLLWDKISNAELKFSGDNGLLMLLLLLFFLLLVLLLLLLLLLLLYKHL